MAETFEDKDLSGAVFRNVNLANARFRGAVMTGVVIRDAMCVNVDVDAMVFNFVVNGVDVVPYVKQELDKRYPIRTLLKPTDPEGMRTAWKALDDLWATTLEKARELPEGKLHESVNDEWSFVETLRHLVFAMDRWFTSPVLGESFEPIGIAPSGSGNLSYLGIDHAAAPSFTEALAVRERRAGQMREYLAGVTPEDLQKSISVPGSGNPTVQGALHVIFDEEWAHNRYATRDLEILSR